MDYLFYAETFLFQVYCVIMFKVIIRKLDILNYIEDDYNEVDPNEVDSKEVGPAKSSSTGNECANKSMKCDSKTLSNDNITELAKCNPKGCNSCMECNPITGCNTLTGCKSCNGPSKKSPDIVVEKKVIKVESSDDEEIEKISKEEEIDILNSFKIYEGQDIESCEKYLKSCNYKLIIVVENKVNKDYNNKYDEYKIFVEVQDGKIIKFLSVGEYFS